MNEQNKDYILEPLLIVETPYAWRKEELKKKTNDRTGIWNSIYFSNRKNTTVATSNSFYK